MSNDNPYEPPKDFERRAWLRPLSHPSSLLGSIRQGAWLGLKWTSIVVVPLAIVLLLRGIFIIVWAHLHDGVTELGNPAYQPSMLRLLIAAFGLWATSCMWGIVAGMLFCGGVYTYRRLFTAEPSVERERANAPDPKS